VITLKENPQTCLPVPACLRAGADTAVGQARLPSGRLEFYPKSIADFGYLTILYNFLKKS